MHSGFSALREVCTMNCGIRVQLKERPPALDRDLARIASLWSEGLSRLGGPWLAGSDFSAVDAFFAPVAFRFQTYGITLGESCDGYARRLLELPDIKAWYAAALAEPYRDLPHEDEALRAGLVVRDLRHCSGKATA
jgi:glutathione S-transferase